MKYWIILLFATCNSLFAQEDASLVGDSMFLGQPAGESFTKVFYMQKTRIDPSNAVYDTLTGAGFHDAFFGKGDFDAKELGAEWAGKGLALLSIELLGDKQGNVRYVAFLNSGNPLGVIWVELEEAARVGELQIEE
jgi:hypothetical protein